MELTHFDEKGNARMVDVGDKEVTKRIAIAEGKIFVCKEVYDAIKNKDVKKGDVEKEKENGNNNMKIVGVLEYNKSK